MVSSFLPFVPLIGGAGGRGLCVCVKERREKGPQISLQDFLVDYWWGRGSNKERKKEGGVHCYQSLKTNERW